VARRAVRWPVWARRVAGWVFTRRVTVSCDGARALLADLDAANGPRPARPQLIRGHRREAATRELLPTDPPQAQERDCEYSVTLRSHAPRGVTLYLDHPRHAVRADPRDPAAFPYDRTDVWFIGTDQRWHP
jgi:hypothetical protein